VCAAASNINSLDTKMQSFTIIHTSDLHLSSETIRDQNVVLGALFKDIEKERKEGRSPDVLFFSGDLIAKGKYTPENISLVSTNFINPLLEAAGLQHDRIFFCPGNHDCDLSKIPELVRPSLDAITTTALANRAIDDLAKYPYFWSGFDGFNTIVQSTVGSRPALNNPLFRAYRLESGGLKVGICAVNSAWRCTGAPNDGDYGRLIIGQRQIDMLASAVEDCDLKLAVVHHPLAWLAPFDSSEVQAQIYHKFDALFLGHNHNPASTLTAFASGTIFVSNAGCLYQSRAYFNGYSIVTFEPQSKTWIVRAREYYASREEFSAATRFAEDGQATFTRVPVSGAKDVITLPSGEYISALREAVDLHLLPSAISQVAPRSLKAMYVEPPLSRFSEKQLDGVGAESDSVNYLRLDELVKTHRVLFFVGPLESGKTTLLHYMCAEASSIGFFGEPTFGACVNLSAIRPSRASILDAIVSFSKGAYRRAEFIDLLRQRRMTVCFDNLSGTDEHMLAAVQAVVSEFPGNRFYFTVSETFRESITSRVIPKLGLEAEVIYIHSFGRRHARSLYTKWFGDSVDECGGKVDEILDLLGRLHVPRTPFLISILLWVRERKVSFSPVNQAEVIDVFIDGILEKLSESKRRSEFDSNAKRHFLGELAYAMHRSGKTVCSYNELDLFAADYFSRRALPEPIAPFIQELQERGILVDQGDGICFKFDCFRAFFLSLKMKDAPELVEEAASREGILRFGAELDYFTGRNRDQAEVLRAAMKALEDAFRASGLDLPLALFDEVPSHGSILTPEKRALLEQKVLGVSRTSEQQQQLLDEIDERTRKQAGSREEGGVHHYASANDVTRFAETLRISSIILRNSELIDDAKLKHESFERVVYYWCQLLLAGMSVVELLADDSSEKALKEMAPKIEPAVARYILRLLVPNVVFALVFESLGTEKLELVLRNEWSNSKESVRRLLTAVLYADLRLQDWIEKIDELSRGRDANRFLLELLFFKVVHIITFRKLTSGEEKKLKNLAGDLFGRINSASDHRTREGMKAKIVSALNRSQVLRSLPSREGGSGGAGTQGGATGERD
jgi:Calcineurin-like phosphoesterase